MLAPTRNPKAGNPSNPVTKYCVVGSAKGTAMPSSRSCSSKGSVGVEEKGPWVGMAYLHTRVRTISDHAFPAPHILQGIFSNKRRHHLVSRHHSCKHLPNTSLVEARTK
ncbi:hypothetical protein E2C01_004144 [Portunus trituberculatus]|uniref:Uncharacterized protein n=1 Tax=Portunus trituberculatus TaxID=210409 RepID=A0A5B7CT76_PORTR|nr:hypothetical protein [Portunus trituberculatus]